MPFKNKKIFFLTIILSLNILTINLSSKLFNNKIIVKNE
jgi:hypothetical protein